MSFRSNIFGQRGQAIQPIPTDNLIAFWEMEETTGTTIFDSIGSHHGTLTNISTATTSGKFGNAFNFASKSAQIPYSTDFDLNVGGVNRAFSVAFWALPISVGSLFAVMGTRVGGYQDKVWDIACDSNLMYFQMVNSDNTVFACRGGNFDKSDWNHTVAVFDPLSATPCQMYMNGELMVQGQEGVMKTVKKINNRAITIGGRNATSSFFNGKIDHVRIWVGKALSSAEVLNMYNFEK